MAGAHRARTSASTKKAKGGLAPLGVFFRANPLTDSRKRVILISLEDG
jgi:hypothetical protein